jgi:hypothetical protein
MSYSIEEKKARRAEYRRRPEVRDRVAIYNRIYRKTHQSIRHKEDKKTYDHNYRLVNGSKLRAEQKIRYAAHREERHATAKIFYSEHKEQCREQVRKYAAKHRPEACARTKAWLARADPLRIREGKRERKLRRKYGLTQASFNALLENQGSVCATCGKNDWSSHGPCVDHDHITGKVRGILCHNCNISIGMTGGNPMIHRAMADYLESHS